MNNLVGQFVTVWLRPWAAMNEVKESGEGAGIKSAMVFVVIMGLLSGIVTAVVGFFSPAALAGSKSVVWLSVLIVPLISFLGSFIGALFIWSIVGGLLRGTLKEYLTTYRILALLAAFTPVSALLTAIPKVGQYLAIAVNVWATIVMIRGIIIVMDTPPMRTWVVCTVLFALLFTFGVIARIAANQQLQTGGNFDSFGTEGDLNNQDLITDDEMEKQLQGMAEKAKTPPTKK